MTKQDVYNSVIASEKIIRTEFQDVVLNDARNLVLVHLKESFQKDLTRNGCHYHHYLKMGQEYLETLREFLTKSKRGQIKAKRLA